MLSKETRCRKYEQNKEEGDGSEVTHVGTIIDHRTSSGCVPLKHEPTGVLLVLARRESTKEDGTFVERSVGAGEVDDCGRGCVGGGRAGGSRGVEEDG